MRNYEDIECVLELFEKGVYAHADGKIYSNGKELKGTKKGKGGYLSFCIRRDGRKVTPTFHLIIFALVHGIEELKKYETVDHIDGDKFNNHPDNLEGCSVIENNKRWYDRYYNRTV